MNGDDFLGAIIVILMFGGIIWYFINSAIRTYEKKKKYKELLHLEKEKLNPEYQKREREKKTQEYYEIAQNYNAEENYNEVINCYDKAIELDSKNATYYNNRAVAKSNAGMEKDAIADYSEAIRIKPSSFIFHTNRARSYESIKRYDLARKDWLTVRNLNWDEAKKLDVDKFRINVAIEINTNYANTINSRQPENFDEIRKISVYTIMCLPEYEKNELWNKLNRGIDILTDELLLQQYIYSFANMHYEKLNFAYDTFVKQELSNQKVDIIDYGCGQALASTVFIDYINSNNIPVDINQIRLIEPSELALSRGMLHVNQLNKSVDIIPICDELNYLTETDLQTNDTTIKLHLFSNILDIKDIKLEHLVELINKTQKGLNYFVCVSPENKDAIRIRSFFNLLATKYEASLILDYVANAYEWKPEKSWTINAKVFRINFCTNNPIPLVQQSLIKNNVDVYTANENINFDMIFVKGGTFQMEDEYGVLDDNSKPVYEVTVSDFYIDKYTVTQKLWRNIMGKDPDDLCFIGNDDNPVENINWYEAVEFCNKLSEKRRLQPYYNIDKTVKDPNNENTEYDEYRYLITINKNAKGFRLPTEAEWEFAARGGNVGTRHALSSQLQYEYSGSNKLDEVGWYDKNSKNTTHPVGQKKPNELGIYDMSGNVWEWCYDWYGEYDKQDTQNPQGVIKGSYRVNRGGSWCISSGNCYVAFRGDLNAYDRHISVGFRFAFSL